MLLQEVTDVSQGTTRVRRKIEKRLRRKRSTVGTLLFTTDKAAAAVFLSDRGLNSHETATMKSRTSPCDRRSCTSEGASLFLTASEFDLSHHSTAVFRGRWKQHGSEVDSASKSLIGRPQIGVRALESLRFGTVGVECAGLVSPQTLLCARQHDDVHLFPSASAVDCAAARHVWHGLCASDADAEMLSPLRHRACRGADSACQWQHPAGGGVLRYDHGES